MSHFDDHCWSGKDESQREAIAAIWDALAFKRVGDGELNNANQAWHNHYIVLDSAELSKREGARF